MSTRKAKRAATTATATATTATTAKKQKVGIDMSHVPQSLLKEGFGDIEDAKVPEYLLCPICKEILIEPEMYTCGHTVCKICITTKRYGNPHARECPVCKVNNYTNTIPNYALKQLIEAQYPTEQSKRSTQLKDIQELAKKLLTYPMSERYSLLSTHLTKYFETKRWSSLDGIMKYLNNQKDVTPSVSLDEFQYFMQFKLTSNIEYQQIGSHVLWGTRGDVTGYLNWLEKNKKKENLNWSSIILLCLNGSPYETMKRLAVLHKINIGDKLPLDEWKNKPAYWLKNLDIGTIKETCSSCHTVHERSFMNHINDSSDYDDSDDDDSDSDGWW